VYHLFFTFCVPRVPSFVTRKGGGLRFTQLFPEGRGLFNLWAPDWPWVFWVPKGVLAYLEPGPLKLGPVWIFFPQEPSVWPIFTHHRIWPFPWFPLGVYLGSPRGIWGLGYRAFGFWNPRIWLGYFRPDFFFGPTGKGGLPFSWVFPAGLLSPERVGYPPFLVWLPQGPFWVVGTLWSLGFTGTQKVLPFLTGALPKRGLLAKFWGLALLKETRGFYLKGRAHGSWAILPVW